MSNQLYWKHNGKKVAAFTLRGNIKEEKPGGEILFLKVTNLYFIFF